MNVKDHGAVGDGVHNDAPAIQAAVDAVDPRLAPVARCLAQLDGRFIGAADWEGGRRWQYEERAKRVLQTVDNVAAGNRTGGLPPVRVQHAV